MSLKQQLAALGCGYNLALLLERCGVDVKHTQFVESEISI